MGGMTGLGLQGSRDSGCGGTRWSARVRVADALCASLGLGAVLAVYMRVSVRGVWGFRRRDRGCCENIPANLDAFEA